MTKETTEQFRDSHSWGDYDPIGALIEFGSVMMHDELTYLDSKMPGTPSAMGSCPSALVFHLRHDWPTQHRLRNEDRHLTTERHSTLYLFDRRITFRQMMIRRQERNGSAPSAYGQSHHT